MNKSLIPNIYYEPPTDYALGIEIFSVNDFKQRVNPQELLSERAHFYMLLIPQSGETTHSIDFVKYHAHAQQWLLIKPNQVHCFNADLDWEGWLMLIAPSALPAQQKAPGLSAAVELEQLPNVLTLTERTCQQLLVTVEQMRQDATSPASIAERNQMLVAQLHTLVLRCHWDARDLSMSYQNQVRSGDLYRRFTQLLEQHYMQQHHVLFYANALGCADKTLTRACQKAMQQSAKNLITERLILEAKRLLSYTDHSVQQIGFELGFEENTNFIKLFKQRAQNTPLQFRRMQKTVG